MRSAWFAWESLCVPISPFSGRSLDPRLYNTNESTPTEATTNITFTWVVHPSAINRRSHCRLSAQFFFSLSPSFSAFPSFSLSFSRNFLVCSYLNEYIITRRWHAVLQIAERSLRFSASYPSWWSKSRKLRFATIESFMEEILDLCFPRSLKKLALLPDNLHFIMHDVSQFGNISTF